MVTVPVTESTATKSSRVTLQTTFKMVLNRLHILNVFQGIALILHFTDTEGGKTLQISTSK